MVSYAFIDIADSGLSGVRVLSRGAASVLFEQLPATSLLTDRGHVTQHLRSVDTDPVERRVRERVASIQFTTSCLRCIASTHMLFLNIVVRFVLQPRKDLLTNSASA